MDISKYRDDFPVLNTEDAPTYLVIDAFIESDNTSWESQGSRSASRKTEETPFTTRRRRFRFHPDG